LSARNNSRPHTWRGQPTVAPLPFWLKSEITLNASVQLVRFARLTVRRFDFTLGDLTNRRVVMSVSWSAPDELCYFVLHDCKAKQSCCYFRSLHKVLRTVPTGCYNVISSFSMQYSLDWSRNSGRDLSNMTYSTTYCETEYALICIK